MSIVTEERCSQALHYLASTDELAAELKGNVARREYGCKLARAKHFALFSGSVEARKASAEAAPGVIAAEGELVTAIIEHEKVKAKRMTEELLVEVWRSCNANRRHGNL
jgi:hypothetical protein